MTKRILLPLLLAAVLMAAGCSSKKTVLPYFQDLPSEGMLEPMAYLPTIQPDDQLQISVSSADPTLTAMFNLPEVNPATHPVLESTSQPKLLNYTVDSQGYITMPQIGKVRAAGLTVEQLQQELVQKISRLVADPQVTVIMANFTVVVAGEVKQPQTVRVPRNRFTILEALSAAGDMTEYGERSNVLLIRETDGERQYIHLNLNESDVLNSPYYYLRPNDYVYVAPNRVRQENSKYNQNNGFKLSVISTAVSAASVIASLVIALTVK